MDPESPLRLVAGQHYATRAGARATVLAIEPRQAEGGVIGMFRCRDSGRLFVCAWNADGRYAHGTIGKDHIDDLVGPWVEPPPAVDWPALPAWARFAAMDPGGRWFWFAFAPTPVAGSGWQARPSASFDAWHHGEIPPEHAPAYAGDWRQSLVDRP